MLLPIVLTIIAVFALVSLAAMRFLSNPVVSRSSFDEDGNEVNL